MKLRDATYVVGGYVVEGGRVLLLWHADLGGWVPPRGRIELVAGEYPHEAVVREVEEECGLQIRICATDSAGVSDSAVSSLPMPAAIQEIRLDNGARYMDFVFYCDVVGGNLALDYNEARAYHWFTEEDTARFPLLPHVREHALRALKVIGAHRPAAVASAEPV